MKTTHLIIRDGIARHSAKTHNECFTKLLDLQGSSVHHATTYEGWKIEKVTLPNVNDIHLACFFEGAPYYLKGKVIKVTEKYIHVDIYKTGDIQPDETPEATCRYSFVEWYNLIY